MRESTPSNEFVQRPDIVENLIVTVEHAATGKMGGIGSYCAEVGAMTQNSVFLLIDDDIDNPPAPNILLGHELVSQLLPEHVGDYRNDNDLEYIVWLLVEQLLPHFPNVRNIDIYEYSGIGARIAEAARSGLLPESVGVRVYCHGGRVQLERATATWGGVGSIRVNNFERSSIENANEVWFASDYLKKLYLDAGMRIDNQRVYGLGYPYSLISKEDEAGEWADVDTLSFVGRLNRLKGFDVFVSVVLRVLKDETARGKLRHIYAIGRDDGEMPNERQKLIEACEQYGVEYVQQQMTRQEVQEFEGKNARNNVFILPYLSDNYSVAILELIERGAPVFCLRTGGTPELIDAAEWQERLADSSDELAKLVKGIMRLTTNERKSHCHRLRDIFITQQQGINQANRDRVTALAKKRTKSEGCKILDVSIVRHAQNGQLSSLTGRYGDVVEETDAYVFLHVETCTGVSEQNRDVLEKAARVDLGSIYSCGYSTPDGVVIPEYIDMASLYTDKRVYAVPCLLLPKQVLNAFLVMYQKDVDTTIDRSPEYLLFALQSYLINTDMAIIPLPKPLVTVSRSLDTSLPTEVMFTSLARYNTQKKWQTYRYGALLRSGVSASHEPIVDLPENSSDIMASDFDKMRLRQMVSLTAKKMRSIVTLRLKK